MNIEGEEERNAVTTSIFFFYQLCDDVKVLI